VRLGASGSMLLETELKGISSSECLPNSDGVEGLPLRHHR